MNNAWQRFRGCKTLLAAALCLASTTGCGAKSVRDATPAKPQVVVEANQNSAAGQSQDAVANITLKPVDRPAFDAMISKQKGRVVLVDFWATWCLPCVEQLPHTLELGRRWADRGLVVVTVSCDEPADADQVAQFLTSKKADEAINLISEFGGSPKSMEAFEITTGAVPFYKLYDRSGELRQTFGINPSARKQYTSVDVDAAVEDLLEKRP